MNGREMGSSPGEGERKPWPRWWVRGLLVSGSDGATSTSTPTTYTAGSTVIREPGLTSHGGLERPKIVGNRTGASGGGMGCLSLALEEQRTVQIDPVLNKRGTMGLDKEVDLCVVIWGRRDKEN